VDGHEITERHGPWLVRMWWPDASTTGGPHRLSVEPLPEASAADTARGISTAVLRGIAPRAVAPKAGPAERTTDAAVSGMAAVACEALRGEGVSRTYLAALAVLYGELHARGERPLVKRLAETVGRGVPTVKAHLQAARKGGYLSEAVAGKPGGEATPKARQVLGGPLSPGAPS
jgi:hypothetical protein